MVLRRDDKLIVYGNLLIVLLLFTAFLFHTSHLSIHISPERTSKRLTGFQVQSLQSTNTPLFDNLSSQQVDIDPKVINKARITYQRLKSYPGAIEAIDKYSTQYNVPKELIYAVIAQESAGQVGSLSTTGALGLMQVQWQTAKDICKFVSSKDQLVGVNNVDNNIHCGVLILLNKYKYAKNGKDPFGCGWDKYKGWQGALRAYNGMCCTYSTNKECSVCHISPDRCDDDYVEHVMAFYYVFGGGQSQLLQPVVVPSKEKVKTSYSQAGYYITPNLRLKDNYNLSVYSLLKKEASQLVEECSHQQDIDSCINLKLKQFSTSSINWKLGFCEDSFSDILDEFTYSIESCINSPDDDCICDYSLPALPFSNPDNKITLALAGKGYGESISMVLPVNITHYSPLLSKQWFYIANSSDSLPTPVDSFNYYLSYNKNHLSNAKLEALTSTLSGTSRHEFNNYNRLILYKSGPKMIILGSAPPKRKCLPRDKVYNFCVTLPNQEIYVHDENSKTYSYKPLKIKFALFIKDKIAPSPVINLNVKDTPKAERTLTVSWRESPEPDVKYYRIYISDQPFTIATDNLLLKKIADKNQPNYTTTIQVPEDDISYYVGVIAEDSSGNFNPSIKPAEAVSYDDIGPMPLFDGQHYFFSHEKAGNRVTFYAKKPTLNADNSTLRDLAGFNIYISDAYFETVDNLRPYKSYSLENIICNKERCKLGTITLNPGDYYYAITAYDYHGNEVKRVRPLLLHLT